MDWTEHMRIIGVAPEFARQADKSKFHVLVAAVDEAAAAADKNSNVVPALLLSTVFRRNVVPLLSLEQQLRDYVAVQARVLTATSSRRCCWTGASGT